MCVCVYVCVLLAHNHVTFMYNPTLILAHTHQLPRTRARAHTHTHTHTHVDELIQTLAHKHRQWLHAILVYRNVQSKAYAALSRTHVHTHTHTHMKKVCTNRAHYVA